ncbi:MAG: hypothetical protein BWX55_00735 [Deltaproteobacteria bacterium ADurb.Bin022]|nr:MAG: hypothetical protein BWX55_00735 [Deltaproteobacteria bacterium ADurb.Bin022]
MQRCGSTGTGVFHIGDGNAFDSHALEGDLAANSHLPSFTPAGIGKPESLNIFFIQTGIFETSGGSRNRQILDALIHVFAEFDCINPDDIDVSHIISPFFEYLSLQQIYYCPHIFTA